MSQSSDEVDIPEGAGLSNNEVDEIDDPSGSVSGEAPEGSQHMFSPPRSVAATLENQEENSDDADDDDEDDDGDFVEGAPSKPPSLLATFYASFASKKDVKSTHKRPRDESPRSTTSGLAPKQSTPSAAASSLLFSPPRSFSSPLSSPGSESKNHRRKRLRYQKYGGLETPEDPSSSSQVASHPPVPRVGEVLVKRPMGG